MKFVNLMEDFNASMAIEDEEKFVPSIITEGEEVSEEEDKLWDAFLDQDNIDLAEMSEEEIDSAFEKFCNEHAEEESVEEELHEDMDEEDEDGLWNAFLEQDNIDLAEMTEEEIDAAFDKFCDEHLGAVDESVKPVHRYTITEKMCSEGWRGCSNIEMKWNGAYSDPDLLYKDYVFNYWDIEDALWNDFLEASDGKWNDSDSDNSECEAEFDKYVQDNAEDYLDDYIIVGNAPKNWKKTDEVEECLTESEKEVKVEEESEEEDVEEVKEEESSMDCAFLDMHDLVTDTIDRCIENRFSRIETINEIMDQVSRILEIAKNRECLDKMVDDAFTKAGVPMADYEEDYFNNVAMREHPEDDEYDALDDPDEVDIDIDSIDLY